MPELQIAAIQPPLDASKESVASAMRLLSRMEFVGLLTPELAKGDLTRERVLLALMELRSAGIGAQFLVNINLQVGAAPTEPELGDLLAQALESLEHSPMPKGEWGPLRSSLDDGLLAKLVHTSPSSLRRYASGERTTPDDVAARLHVLALLTADLSGSYNEYGVRRWFTRPRQALDGKSPLQVLEDGFDPDDPQVEEVRDLAAWLVGAGSAA